MELIVKQVVSFTPRKTFRVNTAKPLSNGNSKLDKGIFSFDLLAVRTCANCKSCAKDCYAKKSEVRFPDTYNKRAFQTVEVMTEEGLERTYEAIVGQLSRARSVKKVRIHSSGDFVSQAYLDMWAAVASLFPEIQFYGYTKVRGKLDFSIIDCLPNVILWDSTPNGELNFAPVEEIKERCARLGGFICPNTLGNKEVHCSKCGLCYNRQVFENSKHVFFVKH
jgi:ferredoxin